MFDPFRPMATVAADKDNQARDDNEANTANLIPQLADMTGEKIFLPRGSTQSRFEPPQYFYLASKGGAVPSWAISSASEEDEIGSTQNFS
jgi:hypothetical protein